MKVVSYGGGTNSTAMLVLLHESGTRPDHIVFADTGGEKPHTYDHVRAVNEWCKLVGFPEIVTVRKRGRIYVGETLEENCLRKNMLPSIAYGYKSCSAKYKIQPQDMYFNNLPEAQAIWADGHQITKYIGYDADETRRAKIFTTDKYTYIYPLITEDWGREECVEAIARAGLPQPGKSACFFCPSSKKAEIVALKNEYPILFERALAMERGAELTSVKGLGRSFSWGQFMADRERTPELFSDAGKEMDCGCYDGD